MGDMYTRNTAVKVSVHALLQASFQKGEGWESTKAVIPSGKELMRANMIGIVVAKEEHGIMINDGSGTLLARNFEQSTIFTPLEVGDTVLVIGKPRLYQDQKYLAVENCKKISQHWLDVRKKELEKEHAQSEVKQETKSKTNEIKKESEINKEMKKEIAEINTNNAQQEVEEQELEIPKNVAPSLHAKTVYDLIKSLDQGDGASYEEVVKQADNDKAEKMINTLLQEGDIFEIRPGKLKVLE